MMVADLIKLLQREDQFAEVWLDSGHHIGQVRSLRQGKNWDKPPKPLIWITGKPE